MNTFKEQFLPIDGCPDPLLQTKDPRFYDKRNTMERFEAISREREIDYRQSLEKLEKFRELKEPPEKWIDKNREKLNAQFLTRRAVKYRALRNDGPSTILISFRRSQNCHVIHCLNVGLMPILIIPPYLFPSRLTRTA